MVSRSVEDAMKVGVDAAAKAKRKNSKSKPKGESDGEPVSESPPTWDLPVFFQKEGHGPPFPLEVLPSWLADWAGAESVATQTPADLAAVLALGLCSAAIAGKYRAMVRPGWVEPLNLFVTVALPPGDRKSKVFRDALDPIVEAERAETVRMTPVIATAASKLRILEARLKTAEQKAAKAVEPAQRERFEQDAAMIAEEIAAFRVPAKPQFFCDDVTPERLAQLLATQGGRMLQTSPEGTAFEIAKGRYSEGAAVFDVYLKAHAGDPLRTGRVGRDDEAEDSPALSVALAVQPDVIRGLAEQTSMRGRGFLARFLYSIPTSLVGERETRPTPVPGLVARRYRDLMLRLWQIPTYQRENGTVNAQELRFSPEADDALADLERKIEPQLAEGAELAHLSGWGNKLPGAVARIASVLHIADQVSRSDTSGTIDTVVSVGPVEAAVRLGLDYFLPHAIAAFGGMGADPRVSAAQAILDSIPELVGSGTKDTKDTRVPQVTRKELYRKHHRRFKRAEEIDPVLDLLIRHGWLKSKGNIGGIGRGKGLSLSFYIHPMALAVKARTPKGGVSGVSGVSPETEGVL